MKIPYQEIFENMLRTQKTLENNTINSILSDVENFFKFINHLHNNPVTIDKIEDIDVKAYLRFLIEDKQIKNSTYNKILSHLNTYFRFIFSMKLSPNYPTLNIKGKDKVSSKDELTTTNWTKYLPEILLNPEISYYTKLTLLLLKKYYPIKDIIAPGFYKKLDSISFSDIESKFLEEFFVFIAPLQKKQETNDLFIKQRQQNIAHPQLSLPALHKYLKKDQPMINFDLSPKKLRQEVILEYLSKNELSSSEELLEVLHLDDKQSLRYYLNLM
ncbi:integrase recombinase xerD [Ligilactobacillus hayakitensis DSM 18933 = JCM 14209]|uniref:Integrase recombinase xerD n=1 Tax=Ligilactobacillus hayakitensis DSM 18933 = JCM 14209 TaxID=1423755 RepID=A0A0R1WMF3_9LACO|nr:site-specific integrase [Ligilactobacillus hayakitensis]KRM18974.1 integrase recombinase xerD [Ligilactobacillus hayakitensis DSM 18933 = JCM 14209]